jgi:AcrR family transcriptional regulator
MVLDATWASGGASVSFMAATLRERRAAHTRAEIVQVALDLFEERGFEAVTAEEIARAAEVSPRTLFRYFESKSSIVLGDFAVLTDHLVGALEERTGTGPLAPALRDALEAAFTAMGRDALRSMHRATRIVRDAAAMRTAASASMPVLDARLVAAMSPWLPPGMDEGRLAFLGVSLNIAIWMAVDGTSRPTSSPSVLATRTVELLGTWPLVC